MHKMPIMGSHNRTDKVTLAAPAPAPRTALHGTALGRRLGHLLVSKGRRLATPAVAAVCDTPHPTLRRCTSLPPRARAVRCGRAIGIFQLRSSLELRGRCLHQAAMIHHPQPPCPMPLRR